MADFLCTQLSWITTLFQITQTAEAAAFDADAGYRVAHADAVSGITIL